MANQSDGMQWAYDAINTPTDPARISPTVQQLLALPFPSLALLPASRRPVSGIFTLSQETIRC